ncbi:MAG: DUF4956 domain-containing protein [Pyrinomonadaceae bacterium]
MTSKKTKIVTSVYLTILFGVLVLAGLSLFPSAKTAATPNEGSPVVTAQSAAPQENTAGQFSILTDLLESEAVSPEAGILQKALGITYRFFFAVLLSALLAFRPMKDSSLFQRNYHVAQTQILLAVVAAALMMIVGNNAARAFAIFAAVSLVRFRTNIRDPKEITVLLVSLAIGLAAGIGRWELGAILCLFVMGLLWVLEFKEDEKTFRTMELKVKTIDVKRTKALLTDTFEKFELTSELRKLNPEVTDDSAGQITYHLNLNLDMSTDYLSEQLLRADSENIKDIRWKHKRKEMYIYQ